MSETYDLAKAGFEAAMAPFAEMLQKIGGPAAEEIGLCLQDHVKVFRLKRQIRLLQKTKEILDNAGIEPRRVPLKLLGTIVDNATLEEDDSLQDMWAALLANNALGNGHEAIFPEILRQLSPADAYLLRSCFKEVLDSPVNLGKCHFVISGSLQKWNADIKNRRDDIPISPLTVENLKRLGLISLANIYINNIGSAPELTRIGFQFMCACEDPAVIKAAEENICVAGLSPTDYSDNAG